MKVERAAKKLLYLLSAVAIVAAVAVAFLLISRTAMAEERRQKIAVIDTGVNGLDRYVCQDGLVDLTGAGIRDKGGHGTHISTIIASAMDPNRQCLLIIKWWHTQGEHLHTPEAAIIYAVMHGARLINLSLNGPGAFPAEKVALQFALSQGVVVVVAAGNENHDLSELCDDYPACYSFQDQHFHVVANYHNGQKVASSNYGGPTTDREDGFQISAGGFTGTGTSQSAAVLTSKLLKSLR